MTVYFPSRAAPQKRQKTIFDRHNFWLLLFLLCFFSSALSQLIWQGLGLIDEALTLISLWLVILESISGRTSTSLRHLSVALLAVTLYIFVSTLMTGLHTNAGYNLTLNRVFLISAGTLNHIKYFYFFWLLLYLGERKVFVANTKTIGWLLLIMITGYAVNVFAEGLFSSLFEYREGARFGQQRAVGFHLTTVAGSTFTSLLAVAAIFSASKMGTARLLKVTFLAIALVGFVYFATTTRSGLATFLIGIGFLTLRSQFGVLLGLYVVASLVTIVALGGFANFSDNEALLDTFDFVTAIFFEPDYSTPRSIMIYYGIEIAADNFPFGAGVSYFASPYSEASPLYSSLGISSLPFIAAFNGVIDSNFASIIGEMGYSGIFVFGFLLWLFFRHSINSANGDLKWFLLFLLVSTILNCVVSPVFFKGDWCIIFTFLAQWAISSSQNELGK